MDEKYALGVNRLDSKSNSYTNAKRKKKLEISRHICQCDPKKFVCSPKQKHELTHRAETEARTKSQIKTQVKWPDQSIENH